MDGPGPAWVGEQKRQRYQIIPDSAEGRAGKPVKLPAHWLRPEQRRFLLQKRTRRPLFAVLFIRESKFPKGAQQNFSHHLLKWLLWPPACHSSPFPSPPRLTSLPGLSWWGQRWQWGQRAPLCQKSWCPVVRYISSAQLCRSPSLTSPTHLQNTPDSRS